MKILLAILLSSILVDNMVLSKFLGICPFLGVSKKIGTAIGMGIAVTFVMVIATAATFPISLYILEPNNLGYLTTLTFILVIASIVQFLETVLKRYIPSLYNALGIYLPLITTNCAVLGITLLVIDNKLNYLQALVNSLGAGLGFLLAMIIFSGIREKLESSDIPKALQGLPISLISAAIISMAFLGFQGLVEGLFR